MGARIIVAIIDIDDDKAIAEDLGTIDYLEREFDWLHASGIYLNNARILDDDDECDTKAIIALKEIF